MAIRHLPFQSSSLVLFVLLVPVLTVDRLADALSGFADVRAAVTAVQADVVYTRSFPVREGQALAVEVGSGDVRVETTAAREASVVVTGTGRDARAEFERLRFTAGVQGGLLVVRTYPPRTFRPRRVDARFVYTVRVPRRFDVAVSTGSGNVTVGSVNGRLTLDTGSGDVVAGDVQGPAVSVDTGSGDVRLGRVEGVLSVDTGSGNVAVARQDGRASVGTGSGDVEVRLDRMAALDVETGSGDVRLTLPRGTGADVRIDGGDVRIDEALAFAGRRERREAVGRIGRGGERLNVETGSGSVALIAR
ncbi:MAG TPA: DUF4097 family beta strand repeat-containing protein [Rubricoccaceae bacterium]|jgi:hypothetical protein